MDICQQLWILYLLWKKTFIVRTRHYFVSVVEIILPGCIIAGILYIRSNFDVEPTHITDPTYFPILTKNHLINDVRRSMLHLYYKPQNPFTDELMENVGQCMTLPRNSLFGFESEDAMLRSYELQQADDQLISVLTVDFEEATLPRNLSEPVPKKLSYKIRSSNPIPDKLFDFESKRQSVASDRLIDKIPMVTVQMCLDDAFIDRAAPAGTTKPEVVIQKMPYPPYDDTNPIELLLQNIIQKAGGMIFFATIYLIPTYISGEKISGVNTLLKMNGVKSFSNLFSWLLIGMCFSIIPVLSVSGFFKISLGSQKPFYDHSEYWIITLALFLNMIHIYAFCLHVASYFSKTWLTQAVATTLPILVNVIAITLEGNNEFYYIPVLELICPTVATMRIFDELNKRENQLTGVHWSNIFDTTHPALTTTGSMGAIMVLSILGIIIHFFLALYINAVLPSKYNARKPLLFFLKYFKSNKVRTNDEASDTLHQPGRPKVFDEESVLSKTLIPGIKLRNLTKYFTCGYFHKIRVDAVRGITLDFYKDQITALLGQNGAGKTTTFSILSGLTEPSAGIVSINGKDVSKDLDEIRCDLGVCPQDNVMFPDLTVLEQLRLIGMLKRKHKTRKELYEEVDDLLNELGIHEKQDVMAEKLSGGQKRRLCLGMALIGNASTLFLDEPTSGMDPETSREIWDLILKYRKKKTIIITTHSMEEADVLGDQIAIMQFGKMKCYGTPMFLKKYYGKDIHKVTLSVTPNCDKEKIRNMIGNDATMDAASHGQIVISVPLTNSLPELLDDIESKKLELGITGVSVSIMSLEQVFLKSAADGEKEEANESVDELDGREEPIEKSYKYLEGSERTKEMIFALVAKKWNYFRRNLHLFLAMIIGVFLAVVLSCVCRADNSQKLSNYFLDLSAYENPEVLIHFENETLGETYKKIVEGQNARGTLANGTSLSDDLLSRAKRDLTYYETRMIISSEFNSSSVANALYSGKATLSASIAVNAMSNLILKTIAGEKYSIVASIGDLPQSLTKRLNSVPLMRVEILKPICLFVSVFFHITALFAKHPHLENATKVKQLQQMAGVSSFMYWATTFAIDYAFYIALTVISVVGLFLADFLHGTPVTWGEIGFLPLLFLLFGVSVLLLAYIHSFMKRRFHCVYSVLCGIPLLLAFVVMSVHEIMTNMGQDKEADLSPRRIFSLQPHVSFLFGYIRLREIASENARCQGLPNALNEVACKIGNSRYGGLKSACCGMECRDGHCENPLPFFGNFDEKNGIEEFVVFLFITPLILLGILCFLEQQIFAKLRSKIQIYNRNSQSHGKIPDDVENEESIVRKGINERACAPGLDPIDKNVFLAHRLRKCYGKVKAVKNVSFRVEENECFGLLGVNGAGKSTTFRMLVGEEIPTSGILYRGKYNMKSERKEFLAGVGYCPQDDALIPYFNAEDHLSLFARLRGVSSSEVDEEVRSWIEKLQLNKHKGKPSGTYSGGNKRRLNIAMALIGGPKMVLLDEPTTGVDPAARRSVWTILQNCQKSGQAIILTSHSMEECEVLCNRLMIMVQGRLLCIGASQELKKRFGAGFNIIIKLNGDRSEEEFSEIKNKIETAFTCNLLDEHPGYLFYHVTNSETTWVKMFGTLSDVKAKHSCIEDFTVSSSTLEQLFMQCAKSEKLQTSSKSCIV